MLAMLAVSASGAAPTWIRVSTPSVEIYTDKSEKSARALLDRFDLLRRVFQESYAAESPAPLRVYLFSSESEYENYRADSQASGFYQTNGSDDFIVLSEADSVKRVASHEYLHMVLFHASAALPHWLEEGLPEFYSTVSASPTRIRVGDAIDSHISLLRAEHWMTADQLASADPPSGRVFYAESWALVHMLSISPQWSKGMPPFIKLLNEGIDQREAFMRAFGRSMEDAIAALHSYSPASHQATFPAPPLEASPASSVTRMEPVDATIMLAGLASDTGHQTLAKLLYRRAAKEHPQSPAAIAGLGNLALAENRKDDARREFERAIALGSRDAATMFELASLTNDNKLLEKTLELDANFADAHFLLGVRATDAGDFAVAIDHLRRAVAVHPRRFSYWHALGYAQAKSGDLLDAAESARRAAIIASTPQEEQESAALSLLASAQPAVRSKKPDVITPPSWQTPKGDARIEGTLTRVDCDRTPVRLVISTGAENIELQIANPKQVELINAGGISTSLACGGQSRPVAVDYLAATKAVTRIEFRPVVIMKR